MADINFNVSNNPESPIVKQRIQRYQSVDSPRTSPRSRTPEFGDDTTFAYKLACDYLNYRLAKDGRQQRHLPSHFDYARPDIFCQTMRRACIEFERRAGGLLANMEESVLVTPTSVHSTFEFLCQEVFGEDAVNWGRIVAVFAFAGRFAMECDRQRMPQLVGSVADCVAANIGSGIVGDWILANGGWDGFVELYGTQEIRAKPAEPSLKRAAASCGALVALATFDAIVTGECKLVHSTT